MRRLAAVLGIVTGLLVVGVVLAGPLARFLDARLNRVPASALPVSTAALELHGRLWVADLHCDAALWDRSLVTRADRGHADLPRLREGNVALQVFSFPNAYPLAANYRRTPRSPDIMGWSAFANRWPRSTWWSPTDRALFQARRVHEAAVASNGALFVVIRARTLASLTSDRDILGRPVAAILAVEGLHFGRDEIGAVDRLFASGVRVFGLAHMSDNAIAGSAHGWKKYGLTHFGRRVVARIDSLGGIVDLAHASEATIDDVLSTSSVPVLVSHTGVDGTCPGERNLSDASLARIAARGGVIGIGFWEGAVCGEDAAAIARAMRHAVDVAGLEAVALGSDFDGAVRTPFDAANLAVLTEALIQEGFHAHEIARIMGLNVFEFFLRELP